ncbi:hypothetical protein DICSQDRAFT_124454 [Dichomitus squalens LYAD-421 SS1]|uniref:uncharacterized protein n=1 Tax=Dichomitus squalens (strain LYAD-421) TaxID=732165 RepID=UPI0004411DFF|nr:uncharacterized protein DICSQDRAFT_124454 [Dichomitus squalens LYAD-421 SS1]EJF65189.1 hypothetical protein DICSQDRAFT_124454 [Dichomitus squalens LYAD-421 SS1]
MPGSRPTSPLTYFLRRSPLTRFDFIRDYYSQTMGHVSLIQESGPFITAQNTYILPRLLSPWDFSSSVDTYLFERVCLNLGGQIHMGTAYMMFEEGAPSLPPLIGPPAPPANSPPMAPVIQPLEPRDPPPCRPTPMPLFIGSVGFSDPEPPLLPRMRPVPTPVKTPQLKVQEVQRWTAHAKSKEEPSPENQEEAASAEDTPMELKYPLSPEPEPEPEPVTDEATKEAPSAEEEAEGLQACYNVQSPGRAIVRAPTPPLILPTVLRLHKKHARASVKDTFDHPKLALQVAEHVGLENILLVPARLWTKDERRFMRLVIKLICHALSGKVGYGEVVPMYGPGAVVGGGSDTE